MRNEMFGQLARRREIGLHRLRLVAGMAVLAVVVAACTGDVDAGDGIATGAATGSAIDVDPTVAKDAPMEAATATAGRDADVAFDVGVTEEACPDAVNPDNGCIYLGTISDLSVARRRPWPSASRGHRPRSGTA